jgi:hypothetical protein
MIISHYDNLIIRDLIKEKKQPLIGLVRIYQDGILNTDQSKDGWLTNMTIATGREFVAQSIFKKFDDSSVFGNLVNYKVDSFGVGSGGSIIDISNNVTLNGPSLCDIGLYEPIKINTSCLPITSINNGNIINNVVKKIESIGPGGVAGSITFEESLSSDFQACTNSKYLTVVKALCIIDNKEPTFLQPGESVKIDEAMLYVTSESWSNPLPFAHICFAPKFIELESTFKIEWYIIC